MKANNNNNKRTKTKAPDFFADALFAVRAYDEVRLKRLEGNLEDLHKRAVKAITVCNNVHGQGYTSISKARTIISSIARHESIKLATDTKAA
jgi:hypothetical protein